jgi:hypothetical protein
MINCKNCLSIIILLFLVAGLPFGYSAIFYDQGTDVVNSTGASLNSGTIEIYIYDASSGGNLIYNENFTNNITNGSWNIKIEPDLEYGKIYYKDYVIEGDNLNFSGDDRIEFQSPFGVINNGSFINFSLISSCPADSSIRQIYENGGVVCEADDSASVDLSDYALTNESETFDENITVTNYGFFGWLGSLTSRISSLFVTNVNTINLTLNGSTIESWDEVNGSSVDTDTQKNATGYLYNDSTTIYLNETKLNLTIDLRDNDTTYSHLSNFTDDLGNRGYVVLSNFTNDLGIGNWTMDKPNYYLSSNPFAFYNSTTLPSSTETDPYWTGNFTLYNSSWSLDTNTQKNATGYLYNDSTTIYLNETKLNQTILSNASVYNDTIKINSVNTTANIKSLVDNTYLNLSGTNANQNINISIYNLTTSNVFGKLNASYIQNAPWLIENQTYISKYSSGNFNGSLYTTGANSSLSVSDSIFQVIGSDGTPRFQVQNGGDNQASFIARSFMVVNQNNTRLNQSQNNLCQDWGFGYIDCNTSTTGADMGVQDDFEVQGLSYFRRGIRAEVNPWGVYSFFGNFTPIASYQNGSYNYDLNYFCDYVHSPFSQTNVDNEDWVRITTGDYEGATGEVAVFVNSSCVRLSNNPMWNINLTSQTYTIVPRPVSIVVDGGFFESYVGDKEESKFVINVRNGTGSEGFRLKDTFGVAGRESLSVRSDTKGFSGTSLYNILFSSIPSVNKKTNNLNLEFDTSNFSGSSHSFIRTNVIGTQVNTTNLGLIEVAGGTFNSYISEASTTDSISKAYLDYANGTTIDVTSYLTNSSSNIRLFNLDNSVLYIGGTTNFSTISFALASVSSATIDAEFFYCSSSGWIQAYGVADTTNGFTSSGSLSMTSPANRGLCNYKINNVTAFANTTNYSYIAIRRTRNNIVSPPIESIATVSGSGTSFILAKDYIKLNGISVPPFTCSATYDGAIYYDTDVKFHCSCKSGTGWVQMNDYTTVCS